MDDLKLYRKRIIPDECILLGDDTILKATPTVIVTQWNTLKPRCDFHHGYSCYFLEKGWKISRICRDDNSLLYWYCDIVDFTYNQTEQSLTATDLLADVVVYPDGSVKVLDIDEIALALAQNLCASSLIILALQRLNTLLHLIYDGRFDTLCAEIETCIAHS